MTRVDRFPNARKRLREPRLIALKICALLEKARTLRLTLEKFVPGYGGIKGGTVRMEDMIVELLMTEDEIAREKRRWERAVRSVHALTGRIGDEEAAQALEEVYIRNRPLRAASNSARTDGDCFAGDFLRGLRRVESMLRRDYERAAPAPEESGETGEDRSADSSSYRPEAPCL